MSANNTDTIDPVSRLDLERWALGTLDPARVQALEAARAGDPDLDQRMQRVRAEIDGAAQGMPQLVLPADDVAPSWAERLLSFLPRLSVGALVVTALALLAFRLFPADDPAAVTYRGLVPEVTVFRVSHGVQEEASALIHAQAGDRIQYEIVATGEGHLAVYNVQDNGEVQVYLAPQPVQPGQAVTRGIILDEYAGSERIFFMVSPDPLDEAAVSGAVQRAYRQPLAELDALPGLDAGQRSVLILKDEP